MPVYDYEGTHYDLPDGLTNEQAIAKIKQHRSSKKSGEQSAGVADFVGGLIETGTTGVLNAAGGLGAMVGGSVRGMLDPNETASSGMEAGVQAYNDTIGKHLAPQTKTGHWIEDKIGSAINSFKDYTGDMSVSPLRLIPGVGDRLADSGVGRAVGAAASVIPEAAMLAPVLPGGKKGSASAPKAKPVDKLEALKQKLETPVEADPGTGVFDEMAGQLRAGEKSNIDPRTPDVMGNMAGELQKAAELKQKEAEVQGMWAQLLQEKNVKKRAAMQAEALAAERQLAMEQDVARKGGLDFNAAERARQEQAPTGAAEHEAGITGDRAIAATAEGLLDPATGAQRGIRAEGVPETRQGTETLYTDPSGQTFRGDPTDPMAVLALERQKEAARNNLQYGLSTKRGQPLDLLTVDNMRKANEGPQLPAGETGLQHQFKAELETQAADSHPFVMKAAERLQKQEELVTKLAEQVKKGRAQASTLAREVKNLENFEKALEQTRANVQRGGASGKPAVPFDFRKQGGALYVGKANRAKYGKETERGNNILGGFRGAGGMHFGKDQNKFIGKTMDAKRLEQAGKPPEQIWQETGVIRGKDGEWRFEIPDKEAKLNPMGFKLFLDGKQSLKLGNVLEHSALFRRYPVLRDYTIRMGKSDGAAHFDAHNREIVFNPANIDKKLINDVEMADALKPGNDKQLSTLLLKRLDEEIARGGRYEPDELIKVKAQMKDDPGAFVSRRDADHYSENVYEAFTGTLLHEIQHAVQSIEGFQPGMNWRMPDGKIDPHEWSRTHGEIEAEAVRSRGQWGEERLNDFLPFDLEYYEKTGGVLMEDPRHSKGTDKIVGSMKGPKGQRGALLIDPTQSKQGKILEDMPALKLPTIVPERLSIEQVKEISKAVPDVEQNAVQRAINLGTKGGEYQALKTDHPIVKYTYEHFSEADRLARGDIQTYVHDQLAPASRRLEKGTERVDAWNAVNLGDLIEKQITPEQMRESGYNERQIAYVETHRAVMDAALEAGNRARAVAGMKPITKRQGYAAMKATGDYRQLVYKIDENGDKVIAGIVGSNFRSLLKHRAKLFMEKGYELGEVKYQGGVPRHKGSAQESLAQVLEIIAKDDPNVAEFIKVMEEVSINEAYSFMNAKKHTLAKKGIFGMEGRKIDEGISPKLLRDLAEKNADEGIQAQLDYAEVMFKWGRMSEAVEKVGPVLADATIDAPNAKLWAEHYVQNALGYNPSKMGHYLEQAIAEGFGSRYNILPGQPGYSVARKSMAVARKSVNTVLLALDPVFNLTNFVQPMKAMPGLMAYLESKGLKKNFDFGTGWSYLTKGAITSWRARTGKPLTEVEAGAFSYAKTHRVYGSDLVESSNRGKKDLGYKVDKVANFGLSNIESGTREVMFLGFVDMLHQNGLSVKNGLYEAAHNLTDMGMNNYSALERPPMYNAMGPLGDMAVNLSSYKHGELSRIALFARQLVQEKTAKPLLTELASQIAFAGMKGVVAYEAADYIYRFIMKALGKPDSLSLLIIRMSEKAGEEVNKLTGAKKDGLGDARYVLSHGGFSMLGLDMSKRLGLGQVVGDNATDILFPGGSKLVDIGAAGYKAATDPTEMNAKRFASEIVPRPGATNMDLEWFSKEKPDGNQGANKRTLEAGVKRTPLDVFAKRIGGTGIHESVEKEKLYQTQAIKQAYADKRVKPLEHARDELFSTGKVSEATVRAYMAPEGNINTLISDINRMAKEQNIPAKDRELLKASMSRSITSLRHAQRLKEVYSE